jgi:hypothetical protein
MIFPCLRVPGLVVVSIQRIIGGATAQQSQSRLIVFVEEFLCDLGVFAVKTGVGRTVA